MNKCTITNKRIIEFYNKNPAISFESVNLIFIDLLECLFKNMDEKSYNSVNTQVLQTIHEINENILQLKSDFTNQIGLKFLETKEAYISEMKYIMQQSVSLTKDNVQLSISNITESLIDKTKLLLNDTIPKSNETLQKEIMLNISAFEKNIHVDIGNLKNETSNEYIQNFMNQFETKFNTMVMNVSNASESRINDTIQHEKSNQTLFREEMKQSFMSISKNIDEQNTFFDKYRNSSYKGGFGENNLEHILSTLYQSAEIVNTSKETASGDFILRRDDYSPILFENKDYNRNVPLEEVKKFIRDIETQQCHGIFLSQHSGITSKQHFEIETKGKNVLIYIHNTQYCAQTIKTAIDIIDSLSDKILELSNNTQEGYNVTEDVMQDINIEVREFVEKKQRMTTMLKEFNSKMEKDLQSLDLPVLCKYITNKFGTISHNKTKIICDICNIFEAHSNKSLAAHKRKCGKQNNIKPI